MYVSLHAFIFIPEYPEYIHSKPLPLIVVPGTAVERAVLPYMNFNNFCYSCSTGLGMYPIIGLSNVEALFLSDGYVSLLYLLCLPYVQCPILKILVLSLKFT